MNGHTLQLGRALKVGEKWKHWPRVKSALRNKYCHIPVLAGFMKTHKQWQPGQPPPQRPVAGADEANNAQLSELLAEIVMAITAIQDKESEVLLRSTEEACAEFEGINNREDLSEFVLFSTDISAMYPSLDIPEVAKIVAKEYLESGLDIDLDTLEMSLYLSVTNKRDELVTRGWGDVTHTRTKSGGRAPGITTDEVCERGPRTKSLFKPPVREPTYQEKRQMFAVMLENLIIEAMAGHIFSFNGTIYRQARGGAIGNILTGSLAALFMVWWS